MREGRETSAHMRFDVYEKLGCKRGICHSTPSLTFNMQAWKSDQKVWCERNVCFFRSTLPQRSTVLFVF
jgi:hypothetical protein